MRLDLAHKSVVIVALENCAVIINGQKDVLKAGDYKEFRAGNDVELRPAFSKRPHFVVVDVFKTAQPLTITIEDLAVRQDLEDASARNQTLLIALASFQIRDERDLADEGEPWKPSRAKLLQLHQGEAVWLKHGMHLLHNTGNADARFITIEW